MADPAKLSQTSPISEPDSLFQNTSFTLTVSSDDELCRSGSTSCGTRLDPSQAAFQNTSDHGLPTSGNARLPTLSNENSDDDDANRSTKNSIMVDRADLMDASGGRSQATSTRGYSLIAKLPEQSKKPQPGKLLKGFRDRLDCLSKDGVESSRKAGILKTWKWEVINCFLAVGLTGSMYTILRRYDGERIPDWVTGINLSTLIALMATILRTMLVYVASEIIGQAKWNYLASGGQPKQTAPVRRLIETSRFNDASQGLLGAVRILPTIIRDPATLMAVMVMIISLGTGSFVQQAIQTQSCQFPVDGAHASLPISRNFTASKGKGDGRSRFGPTDISNMLVALSSALAPENEGLGPPIAFVCSTGNCTFENPDNLAHSTLGVCSSCVDTSSLITSSGWESTRLEPSVMMNPETGEPIEVPSASFHFTANYALPNGMSIQASFNNLTSSYQDTALLVSADQLGLNWAGDLIDSEMKAVSQWAFANVTVLSSTWLPTSSGYTDYVAATCTLYPCLRSYNAAVISGELGEVVLGTIPTAPNVAASFSQDKTNEDIQQAMQEYGGNPLIYGTDTGTLFQAIQSPCLVNNTIWTKENQSSNLETQRVILLHADPDSSGGRRIMIANTTAPEECIFGMDVVAQSDFLSFMTDTTFNGNCSAFSEINDVEVATQVSCGKAYWLASFYSVEGTTAAAIIKQIEAFTDRLSNKMRMGLLNDPEFVSGQVLQATVCSRMQYCWLAFPAVLVGATNGLLAWTMFQSFRRRGRVMVWKTSILPLLFYSEQFVVQNAEDVSSDSTELLRRKEGAREPLLDLGQMEAEARQRIVRFEAFS